MEKVMTVEEYKEEYFSQLFVKQVQINQTSKDGQFVEVGIKVVDKSLRFYFDKLYQKYRKGSHVDFISECIYWSWVAVNRFEIQDEGDWEDVISGEDKLNINKLKSNIKKTVSMEIIKYSNPDLKYLRAKFEGESRQLLSVKLAPDSLNSLLINGSEDAELQDVIGVEQSFWSIKDAEYEYNHFIQWFKANKDSILLDTQIKLLEDLKKAQKINGYTNVNDVEAITGTRSNRINHRLNKINERVLRAWELANPDGQKSFKEMEEEKIIHLLHELIFLSNDDSDLINQNKIISEWVIGNLNNDKISDLLFEGIEDLEEVKKINQALRSGFLPAGVIYRLIDNAKKLIESFDPNQFEKQPFKVKKVEQPVQKENRESHASYTFDSKGNLLAIQHVIQPVKKIIRVELTPNGLWNRV